MKKTANVGWAEYEFVWIEEFGLSFSIHVSPFRRPIDSFQTVSFTLPPNALHSDVLSCTQWSTVLQSHGRCSSFLPPYLSLSLSSRLLPPWPFSTCVLFVSSYLVFFFLFSLTICSAFASSTSSSFYFSFSCSPHFLPLPSLSQRLPLLILFLHHERLA